MCSCLYLDSAGHYFCVCMTVFLISGAQGFLSLLPKGPQPATALCVAQNQVFVAGSLANTTFWHRDTQARLTWAQHWEQDGKVGLHSRLQTEFGLCFDTLSWHCCHQPGLCLQRGVLTGAAEGLWGQTWGHRGVPTSQGSHPTLPPAGNWPCEQQGSHGASSRVQTGQERDQGEH